MTDLPPDRSSLATESRLDASLQIDALSTQSALYLINDQDATVAATVRKAVPQIAALVDAIVANMRGASATQKARLIYLGAGTSGRLGVLDASECPPTFHVDSNMVIGLIAGGDGALRKSSEGKEDDAIGAVEILRDLKIGKHDTVVGIAAGGTTPYVWGALDFAKSQGSTTALLCCVPYEQASQFRSKTPQNPAPDHILALVTGAEVLTGSTRMKAGTATKLALNMISTTVMIQLGKAWGHLMVDVRATNAKLRDRAARIIQQQTDLSREQAMQQLDAANGSVKLALVMALKKINDAAAAQKLLDEHHGQLRAILGAPK